MLTRHPENKTARGTGMKLTNREQQSEGTYKLRYAGKVQTCQRQETLSHWLRTFGPSSK